MVASPTVTESNVAEDFEGPHERLDKDITELPFIMDCKRLPIIRPVKIIVTKNL